MAGVKSAVRALAAMAALAALPAAALAQTVEISYKAPRPEAATHVVIPAEPMALSFGGSPVPFRLIDSFEESDEDRAHRAEQLTLCSSLKPIPGVTALDVVFGLPSGVIEWAVGAIASPGETEDMISLRDERQRSLIPRLLAGGPGSSPRAFDEFVNQFLTREQKYFARFQDSSLSTFGVEDGTAEVDRGDLLDDQRKIAFDALRKLYLGGFGTRLDDRMRDEALDVGRWHPVDWVVGPAVLAGYVYVRGWEKKIGVGAFDCRFQIEPLHRIIDRLGSRDVPVVSAASLEIGVGGFPIRAIVSVGIMDGDPLLDFIGIGTSLGKAKQCVKTELPSINDDP